MTKQIKLEYHQDSRGEIFFITAQDLLNVVPAERHRCYCSIGYTKVPDEGGRIYYVLKCRESGKNLACYPPDFLLPNEGNFGIAHDRQMALRMMHKEAIKLCHDMAKKYEISNLVDNTPFAEKSLLCRGKHGFI